MIVINDIAAKAKACSREDIRPTIDDLVEYKRVANPQAILELISMYRAEKDRRESAEMAPKCFDHSEECSSCREAFIYFKEHFAKYSETSECRGCGRNCGRAGEVCTNCGVRF